MRGIACSTTNSTDSRGSSSVSTPRKSVARMPRACPQRKCCQRGPSRRGAGSMSARFRSDHTVPSAIWWPSPASSPWILRYPRWGSPKPVAAPADTARMPWIGRCGVGAESSVGSPGPVPAQHRGGGNDSMQSARLGQQPVQRCEYGSVCPGQPRSAHLATEHGDLDPIEADSAAT
jgi:hypothetical protein